MQRRTKLAITSGVTIVAIGTAAGVGVATTRDDDQPLEGATYEQAVAAATAEVDGEVVETEVGDDGATYEVEIRTPDGAIVEVELDEGFAVISTEVDDEDDDDTEGDDDD